MLGPGLHQHPQWRRPWQVICTLPWQLSVGALLTLHRLDKVLDGVRPDTKCRTLLHELGWDMVVSI